MTDETSPNDAPDAGKYAGPEQVLSGVQPSGALHLGNYLGALKKFVALQDRYPTFLFVADMQALTVWQDPKKAAIFPQSAISAHAELTWIFNCVARLGWLDRMTQFKEKSGKHKERSSVGLYTYPVLQAADILAYKATKVPVGEDQRQHLELTRDIAQKFNNDYAAPGFFPLTEGLIAGPGARVMSLRDGTAKMSKSDPSDNSRINLTDTPDDIAQKVRKAKTDPEPLPETEEGLAGRPEADNLVGVYGALSGKTKAEVIAEFGGKGFGTFKPALADLAVSVLSPEGESLRCYLSDPAEIDRVLKDGAERAAAVADPVVEETRRIVGFWRAQ